MDAPGREDFKERYDNVAATLKWVGYTPDELRGMLAVALDRLAH